MLLFAMTQMSISNSFPEISDLKQHVLCNLLQWLGTDIGPRPGHLWGSDS